MKNAIIALGTVLGVVLILVVVMLIYLRPFADHYVRDIIGQRFNNSKQGNSNPVHKL
jgi:hypothetical protein